MSTLKKKSKETGVDKDGGDMLFSSITSQHKENAIITDLLLRDVRYHHSGSSLCSGCAEEVSISYYKDGSDASLFSHRVCLHPLQLFIFCIVYPAVGAVNILLVCCPPCFLYSISLCLFFFFCFVFQEIVGIAINKVQPKGGEINSGTLGL